MLHNNNIDTTMYHKDSYNVYWFHHHMMVMGDLLENMTFTSHMNIIVVSTTICYIEFY